MDASSGPGPRPFQDKSGPRLSIWARLVLVVLAGVIPMGVLTAAVVFQTARDARDRQEETLLYSARTVLSALDARVNQYIALARALGASRAAQEDNLTEFRRRALAAFPEIHHAWATLADTSGNQIFNMRVPAGVALPPRAPEAQAAQERALETGRAQVSNVFVGPLATDWVATIVIPVYRDGAPFRILGVVMSAESFVPLLNLKAIPDGWVAAIADREGHIVARSRDHYQRVGQPVTQDWWRQIAGRNEGIQKSVTLEGEPTITGFAISDVSGWVVAVGSSVKTFEAPIRDIVLWANTLGVGVTAASILLALWAALRISEPMQALERNAAALVAGQTADVRSRVPEVQRVWTALTDAVADRAQRMAALKESEGRFRALADSAPVLIWVNNTERTEFVNRYYVRFVGAADEDIQGFHILRFMHPDDRDASVNAYIEARRRRGVFEAEFRLRRHDGVYRWMKTTGLPRLDDDGRFLGYVGSTFDVTDLKAREQHIEFILGELSHRSKNLLAVVQAIARQTARQSRDFPSFEERFSARVRALSDAHDLLVKHEWTGARIREVVLGQLLPFEGGRVEVTGEDLTIRPEAVQNLVMALHELATNASKHGALSVPQGRVSVSWRVEADRFRLTWAETGGPPVEPPAQTGFGTIVLKRVTPESLGGTGTLDYRPTGLVWTLDVPAKWIGGTAGIEPLKA